jgi:hypothetical protein
MLYQAKIPFNGLKVYNYFSSVSLAKLPRSISGVFNLNCLKIVFFACHASASNPFLATRFSNFRDEPRGRFLPCSHCLIVDGVTFKYIANTG